MDLQKDSTWKMSSRYFKKLKACLKLSCQKILSILQPVQSDSGSASRVFIVEEAVSIEIDSAVVAVNGLVKIINIHFVTFGGGFVSQNDYTVSRWLEQPPFLYFDIPLLYNVK